MGHRPSVSHPSLWMRPLLMACTMVCPAGQQLQPGTRKNKRRRISQVQIFQALNWPATRCSPSTGLSQGTGRWAHTRWPHCLSVLLQHTWVSTQSVFCRQARSRSQGTSAGQQQSSRSRCGAGTHTLLQHMEPGSGSKTKRLGKSWHESRLQHSPEVWHWSWLLQSWAVMPPAARSLCTSASVGQHASSSPGVLVVVGLAVVAVGRNGIN